MTTEPTDPKPAPAPATSATFSKPVLVAGLLGGLLGAVCSFALARALPTPVKPPPPAPPSEARQFAEQVLGLLKAGKHDDFMSQLRPAFPEADDEKFKAVREGIEAGRKQAVAKYGGVSEFEYCRESALSPTLTRVVFLEKFPQGCVVWSMMVYQSPGGWLVVSCQLGEPGRAADAFPK